MKDLAIQIVNYKTKKYLEDCLDDVLADLKGNNLNYEISVLDNDSGDNLLDLEEKYSKDKINFCYSSKNLGFGGGHNFLAKKADSKFLLILNPDLKFIEKQTIKRLFLEIDKNKNIKIVGPKVMTKENKPQRWDHGQLKGLLAKITLRSGNSYWKNLKEASSVAWVSGTFLMIETKTFKKIKGFDENFFLYKEEEDLCLRVRDLAGEIWYFPQIKICHIGSVVAKRYEYMEKSSRIFDEKHLKNKPGFLFFRTINKTLTKIYNLTGRLFKR